MSPRPASPVPALAADDLWRFGEGTHDGLAYLLGAHPDADGTTFRVWAPSARSVSVIGDFDGWSRDGVTLSPSPAGIWAGRVDAANVGNRYKYRIVTTSGAVLDKSDPFAFAAEEPPRTASVITTLDYDWGDSDWMAQRAARNRYDAPISTYEMHLGSWRYEPGGYRAIAVQLADYLERTGFTHVELMPVMEHPYYGSWGYQTTGYFAATARYGSPQDLMFMIDHLHQRGFGVDPRLGSVALPDRRPRTRRVRRHPSVRARRSTTRLPPRLEERDLQLRPPRGSQLPPVERPVLGRALPRRCDPRRRRRVDVVPRLLASRRGVDPQPARWTREPRRDRVPAGVQPPCVPAPSRHVHRRRGVHRLAGRHPSDRRWRARLRFQVGHGVDERHPRVLPPRAGTPSMAPRRADVPHGLRVPRVVRAPAVARRGRPRQGIVARPVNPAIVGSSSPACVCSSAISTASPARS